MKLGIALRRKNRRGRRFALNFQVGYDGPSYDDEGDPPESETSPPPPEEPNLQEIPPKTEEPRT